MNILDLPKAFVDLIKNIDIIALPEGNGWRIDGKVLRMQWISFIFVASLALLVIGVVVFFWYREHKAGIIREALKNADHQLPIFMSDLEETTAQLITTQKKLIASEKKEKVLSHAIGNLQAVVNKKTGESYASEEKVIGLQEAERLLKIQVEDLTIALDTERANRFSILKKEREELNRLTAEYNNAIAGLPPASSTGEMALACGDTKVVKIRPKELFRRCDHVLGVINEIYSSSLLVTFDGRRQELQITESIRYPTADRNCHFQLLRIEGQSADIKHSCTLNSTAH